MTAIPLRARYVETLDRAFETYTRWIEPMRGHWGARFPKPAGGATPRGARPSAPRRSTASAACLPAATRSNVGIFGTGQGYEALLLRMRAHPLREVRDYADLMLARAAQGHPRVPPPARAARARRRRGPVPAETREATAAVAARLLDDVEPEPRAEVTLTDFDPDGEVKVVAAALYAVSALPDDQLLAIARKLGARSAAACSRAYVGRRENRRHKPGRAFERTAIASTCSATTAPSATSSATGCSRSSGSACRPATAT